MTAFDATTHKNLVNLAKKHIENNDTDSFVALLKNETYTVSVKESDGYYEEQGTWDTGMRPVFVPDPIYNIEVHTYITHEDKNALLTHAYLKNNLEIMKYLALEGYYLNDAQFKHACKRGQNANNPLLEAFCEEYLHVAVNTQNYNFTKTILESSPHLKVASELPKRLEAIEPLFSQLGKLQTMELDEEKAGYTDSAKKLHSYADKIHGHIKNFITGKSDGVTFEKDVALDTTATMEGLEEQSEATKIMKNILLTITGIGPFIKRFATGSWFFENSTTSAVREMKNSLSLIKASGKMSEPQSNLDFETTNPGMP